MPKLYKKIGFVAALTLSLNGCLATEKLDYELMKQEDAKWVAESLAPISYP